VAYKGRKKERRFKRMIKEGGSEAVVRIGKSKIFHCYRQNSPPFPTPFSVQGSNSSTDNTLEV
jgi:hypothetical protein